MDDAHDDEQRRDPQVEGDPLEPVRCSRPAAGESLFATLGAMCTTATRLVGVDGAAVAALMSTKSRELVYATDAVAEQIDEMQFAVGEGPCLDAYASQTAQLCPRLDGIGPLNRWLAFSSGVQDLGVQAVFAFPVPGSSPALGILEFYRRAPGALNGAQLQHASNCAEAIGYAILSSLSPVGSPSEAALRAETALVHPGNPFNRSEVYLASGIIAWKLGVHPDEALVRLRARAYAQGITVTRAAADIVAGRFSSYPGDGPGEGDWEPRAL
jgi:hypothetical protein